VETILKLSRRTQIVARQPPVVRVVIRSNLNGSKIGFNSRRRLPIGTGGSTCACGRDKNPANDYCGRT